MELLQHYQLPHLLTFLTPTEIHIVDLSTRYRIDLVDGDGR